jgi:hypothetical protein
MSDEEKTKFKTVTVHRCYDFYVTAELSREEAKLAAKTALHRSGGGGILLADINADEVVPGPEGLTWLVILKEAIRVRIPEVK